jgi:metallo-beta-lactamase class B
MGMKPCIIRLFAVVGMGVGLALGGCQSARVSPATNQIVVSEGIVLHPIAPGVWVHTTYFNPPGYGRVSANGLLVIDGREALLIDLPWTDELTAGLFDWIAETHGATVTAVVPTHFHEDCMGGLAEAHRRGATSYALDKTIAIAQQKGLPVPRIPYQFRTMVRCGRTPAIMTYFGAGHTVDNVVAWLPRQGILFGGCLLKSQDSSSLGNTADGDLAAYPTTLQKVRVAYRRARIVVPGHGDWGGPELIDHTLKLCRQNLR